MELIDLTLELGEDSLSYPGTVSGLRTERVPFDAPGGTLSTLSRLDPHCGTHFDAPLHFVPGGADVASSPLRLPTIVVISATMSPIPVDVLPADLDLQGRAVLFSTGWSRHAGTPAFFHGYPFLSLPLAERLIEARVGLVGLDSPSADPPGDAYLAHRCLLSAGVPIVEGLIHLSKLADRLSAGARAWLAAFPLRVRGLEGSPVRAVAILKPLHADST